jgi:hypothetical protein
MEKKDKVSDLLWDIGANTGYSFLDLAPLIIKNKNHRILFFASSFTGIIPIMQFNIEPRFWALFSINYFLFSGTLRTFSQSKHRSLNRELNAMFNKKVSVINSIDKERFVNRVNEISSELKNNLDIIKSSEYENKYEFIKIILKTFHKNNIFQTSMKPIKNYVLRSSIPIETLSRKKSELSHLLDTNIISIAHQGKSKKIIILKTCKQSINDTNKISDKIQFLLNELNFNILSVKENKKESMTIYIIRTTSEFKEINKKCDYLASRLGIDKKKVSMTENKGIIQMKISGESKSYSFKNYIDLPEVKTKIKNMKLPALLGVNLENGKLFIQDLVNMPHCLIMGGTGNGKSNFINCLIQSLMYFRKNTVFIMFDFKFLELNFYEDFQNVHFVNNYRDANRAIDLLKEEMNRRLQLFSRLKVKNLSAYNKKYEPQLPYISVIVDEAADLILEAENEKHAKALNKRLNQIINKCRAAGVIIVYAMQRANSDQVNTGVRSQLMTKIGFATSSEKEKQFIEIDDLNGLEVGEFRWKKAGEKYFVKALFIDDENDKENIVYEELKKNFSRKVNLNKESEVFK